MANEIQYRNHTAYNNGTSAENNIKLLDITPFQHEDLSSGVNKLGKMLVAQSFCEPVAVCNSNNPQNGAYVATCSNYPDFALSYQDAQQNTHYLIGLKIRVIFTYGITYGSVSGGTYPTLNINGSGAKPMLAQGKTMASGAASAGQSIEFTVIPYGNGVAFDADSNVRESTSDYTIYTDGHRGVNSNAINTLSETYIPSLTDADLCIPNNRKATVYRVYGSNTPTAATYFIQAMVTTESQKRIVQIAFKTQSSTTNFADTYVRVGYASLNSDEWTFGVWKQFAFVS